MRVPQEVYIGEDFFLPLLYQFELCGVDYPLDISGYLAVMEVNYAADSTGEPLVTANTVNGYITIDGPGGKINIWVPKTVTATLLPGCYLYDLWVTTSVGLTERLFGGSFTVKQGVSE